MQFCMIAVDFRHAKLHTVVMETDGIQIASKTEMFGSIPWRVPQAGASNGRYNPRARAATRVGIEAPALRSS